MYFDNFSEFIEMGGHGLYVWLAYAAAVIILVWNLWVMRLERAQKIAATHRSWARESTANSKHSEKLPEGIEEQL